MNTTFERMYRQLGRITVGVLIAALGFLGLALVAAILGFSQAVSSLRGAAFSVAYVFVVMLALFLVTSVVAAVIRWMDRRSQLPGANS